MVNKQLTLITKINKSDNLQKYKCEIFETLLYGVVGNRLRQAQPVEVLWRRTCCF